ncbi:hypothetical protein MJO28_001915, partial [Puccinia striiformis f. sp. tritici]
MNNSTLSTNIIDIMLWQCNQSDFGLLKPTWKEAVSESDEINAYKDPRYLFMRPLLASRKVDLLIFLYNVHDQEVVKAAVAVHLYETVEDIGNEFLDALTKLNPHVIPPVSLQGNDQSSHQLDFHDCFGTLRDSFLIATRQFCKILTTLEVVA